MALALLHPSLAQAQAEPRILLVLDTSDSMGESNMHMVKTVLGPFVDGTDAVQFALASLIDPTRCPDPPCDCSGANAACDGSPAVLVHFPPIGHSSQLVGWLDGTCAPADPELQGTGGTNRPLGPLFESLHAWLATVLAADEQRGCRPYHVILLTDGTGTCLSAPQLQDAVAALFDIRPGEPCSSALDCPPGARCTPGGCSYEVPTHVISLPPHPAALDAVADAGDDAHLNSSTTALCAVLASDLHTHLHDILWHAVFPDTCAHAALPRCPALEHWDVPYPRLCGSDVGQCEPGITACDPPALTCKGGIGPTDEICDGLDNDCNHLVDDGLPLGDECGTDVGECATGHLVCLDGETVCAYGVEPTAEICDGLDNDCDGTRDDDATCPLDGWVCLRGYCCQGCHTDADCPPGDACAEVCCESTLTDPCEHVECDCGQYCDMGLCHSLCERMSCPPGCLCVISDCEPVCAGDCEWPDTPEPADTATAPDVEPDTPDPRHIVVTGAGGCACAILS